MSLVTIHHRRAAPPQRCRRSKRWRSRRLWAKRRPGVLPMNTPVAIQIVGAPIACAGGVKDTWREVAAWAASQLQGRFGDVVRVDYYDLFDPACPELPPGVQLPLVLVNGEVLSSGRKISIPAIRRHVEALELSAGQ